MLKLLSFGCRNTHFANANGIHADNHYTTASDLATITRYCMKNETFRKMVSTLEYTLPATEQYPSTDRILKNSNSLLIPEHNFYYPDCIGIKTGFTTQAKNCLIAASHKNGLELISIVLHAELTEDGRSARYLDTIHLLDYGNSLYSSHTILEKGQVMNTVEIENASQDTKKLNIIAKDKIDIALPNSAKPEITSQDISIHPDIKAPIEAGTSLGTATFVINNQTYTSDLIAESNVELAPILETPTIHFLPIVYIFIALVIIRLLIAYFKNHLIVWKSKKSANKYLNP